MRIPLRIRLIRLSSVQLIVLFYILSVCVSTALLSLPVALQPGVEWSFINALFTAISAISVTGLTVVPTAETFSTTGAVILTGIFQIGGIGVMALGTFIWLLLGKKIGLKERQLISTDQNQSTLAGLVRLMRQILGIILAIEAVGTLILGLYFTRYFDTWQEAFFQAFFAAVSATTNAGFDITGSSLVPFANDYFVQFINMALLIMGAIGFPVLIELKEYLMKPKTVNRFSLFFKLTTATYFLLVVVGALVIYLFESQHFLANKSWHESLFYSLFQSVTARNGGLATMDISAFSPPTLLAISMLMFIGASPSSVGGGIRTTTFALVVLAIIYFARGKKSIKIFRREIDPDDVIRSFVVVFTALFLCFTAVVILAYLEPFSLTAIVFEVCSAFGTTGLSMGITPELSTPGKIVLMFLMFVGRIGIVSFLLIIRGNPMTDRYKYPKEKIIIG